MKISRREFAFFLGASSVGNAVVSFAQQQERLSVNVASMSALDVRNLMATLFRGKEATESKGFLGSLFARGAITPKEMVAKALLQTDQISRLQQLGKSEAEINEYLAGRFDVELLPAVEKWSRTQIKTSGHFITRQTPDMRRFYRNGKFEMSASVDLFSRKNFLVTYQNSYDRMMNGTKPDSLQLDYAPMVGMKVDRYVSLPLSSEYDKENLTSIFAAALDNNRNFLDISFDYEVDLEPFLRRVSDNALEIILSWKVSKFSFANLEIKSA